ncbi:polysaccharide deacetylase family protein [Pelagicoccus sp. SDUM812003]|uniref:polysaccharide deacetylase family protein n=1 Tax=Pelagicoccus sp. SDUM812003 TaxID=3041267 RepID=UPI00280D4CE4|nr:polysaccharide deacetylase family protein [Pelagicoccus sp. SDUM812003]MDQ8205535.1 polysaccharide deacetylase family protein [Pelagicoccus sp. SDUM812003]
MLRFLIASFSLVFLAQAAPPMTPPIRIALVFDDGPAPEQAPKLLEILASRGVRATFAHVGETMSQHPQVARLISERGHEIANHSLRHRDPDSLSPSELQEQIQRSQAIMASTLDTAPRWYWPPFLKTSESIREACRSAGIALYEPASIVVSQDYDTSVSADEIERLATTGVTDGAVILFHEWRKETADRLPAILDELKRQGCVFHTFTELHQAVAASAP